jgi:hypothetical protein
MPTNPYILAIETRLAGLRKGLGEIENEQARLGANAVATQGAIQILEDLLGAVLTLESPAEPGTESPAEPGTEAPVLALVKGAKVHADE